MRDNAGVGRLNVFASSLQDDEPLEVMLWSRQGDQGDRTKGDAANWLSAQINVQHDYKHAINIQAIRGHGYLVIIDLNNASFLLIVTRLTCCFFICMRRQPIYALDDIDVREGHCPDVDVFKCDFETDICDMSNDVSSDYYWSRKRGPSAEYNFGPSIDHTVSQ